MLTLLLALLLQGPLTTEEPKAAPVKVRHCGTVQKIYHTKPKVKSQSKPFVVIYDSNLNRDIHVAVSWAFWSRAQLGNVACFDLTDEELR